MSKKTIVWSVIATVLTLIGAVIFAGVMMRLDWDFKKLSIVQYETNDYAITDNYRHVKIVADTADVVLVPAETAVSRVVCYEHKHEAHAVTVTDDTLTIEITDTRHWYERIGIFFDTPRVTVYMPQGAYGTLSVRTSTGDVTIPKAFSFDSVDVAVSTGDVSNAASTSADITVRTSTGDITVEAVSAGRLRLSTSTGRVAGTNVDCVGNMSVNVSTGKTQLTNVACQNLLSEGDTGDIMLQNVVAAERFSIERSTGDVQFNGCDAAAIEVETDTGNVKGNLLTDKVFIVSTDTGRVDVPKSTVGGRCEIETDTGDVLITIGQYVFA